MEAEPTTIVRPDQLNISVIPPKKNQSEEAEPTGSNQTNGTAKGDANLTMNIGIRKEDMFFILVMKQQNYAD